MSGLPVIPGTFNMGLTQPFDVALLEYAAAADYGFEDFNPAEYGLEYEGEIGMHYGRVTVAGEYPACLIIPTWTKKPAMSAELISPHHLRSVLNVQDGDTIEFTLDGD